MPRPRSWTDDDLRLALDGAATLAEVVRRLRLARGGASYTTVRTRMEQLGLELAPSTAAGDEIAGAGALVWRRSFTEDHLRSAVSSSRSLSEVFRELGLQPGGGQWLAIRQLIVERGWSTSHWKNPLDTPAGNSGVSRFRAVLAETDIEAAVRGCRTRAEFIRQLGFEPCGSVYRALRETLRDRGITAANFEAPHNAMRRAPRRSRRPLSELLVRGSQVGTAHLRTRLIEEGILPAQCARCRRSTWLGGPIPLQLDHIDGDRTNNLLRNLRLLCPNCHALTDTYCGRNVGRYDRTDEHDGGDGE